jgi:hypothetical protein
MVRGIWRAGVGFLSVAAVLVGPADALSQGAKEAAAARHLASLKAGDWIQLQGLIPGPTPLACTEMRQLAGDYLDDDWALKGVVTAIDGAKKEFAIGRCRVRVGDNTTYDNPRGGFNRFADLRTGMLIEVEGAFLQDGVLLAAEVDDESDELKGRPKLKDLIDVVGRIQRVDLRQRTVTIMGLEFRISDKTKLRSAIH